MSVANSTQSLRIRDTGSLDALVANPSRIPRERFGSLFGESALGA
jgi:hypothetical protein